MPMSFTLADRIEAGQTILLGWVGTPEPLVVETVARAGFDAVNLDMQHGLQDPGSVMRGIGALALAGVPAVVRVPVGDFAMASRALDMGAEAVIAPMINTVDDARAFADAMKFPPVGRRSWGPTRAMALLGETSGARYLGAANRATIALAMIETPEAIENLDAILAVDGIDGVFVGPSDLSLTLSSGAIVDSEAPLIEAPIRRILEAAKARGKIPAIFSLTGGKAKELAAIGYRVIAVGVDAMYLTRGAQAMLAEARG